jgi:small subunit ribosomal protein S17
MNMNSTIQRAVRKEREGIVISDAMDKTVIVRVERRFRHPVYGKELTSYKKYYAHDEKNEAKVGDVVRLVECRPLSRMKRWRLIEIVRRGTGEIPGRGDDSAQDKS